VQGCVLGLEAYGKNEQRNCAAYALETSFRTYEICQLLGSVHYIKPCRYRLNMLRTIRYNEAP